MTQSSQFTRRHVVTGAATLAGAGLAASQAAGAPAPLPAKWDQEADIVIAGGGVAGCMAAIEAAGAGAKVLLLQATPDLGGNSRISSAWIRSANTRWHKNLGIQDTTEAYAKDIIDYGGGTRDEKKAKVIAEVSGRFVDRLMDYGVKFSDEKDTANGGPTLRVPKVEGRGAAVMAAVGAQVRKTQNITVKTDSKILDVYLDGDKVAGVSADLDGKKVAIKAKAVVLATGGFGRNQKLVEKYTNQWKETFRIMDVEDKGDGLLLASALGAGVANLQVAMVTPLMEYSKRIFYSSLTLLAGAIFVNEQGKRFVNELIIYTTTNTEMLKQKASYQIVCEGLHPMVEEMIKNGVTTRADTIEELAQKLGVPVENIKPEIEEHNRITAMSGNRVDRLGRTVFGKPLKAPFYFLRMHPVMIETVGGITIDDKAQVVTLGGKPVAKGFYAAGAVAFGEHFGRGYRSGDAYVYSGVFGMVAGQESGRYAKA
jgi:fumarate reductase flavoprotein subunit